MGQDHFSNNGNGLLEIYSWDSPPAFLRTQPGNGRFSFVEVRNDFFFYAAGQTSSTERIWTPEGGDSISSATAQTSHAARPTSTPTA